jgi:hypothetical protein
MLRRAIILSAAALICASAQIALAEENGTEARAVERAVHGNDMTYHRHYHHEYSEHRHYAEHHRYHHTYVQ